MKKYLVGGAVRDMLLGVEPKDRDWVVVGSTPEEMLSLGFSQVGESFPVFLHPETNEEYALARTERKTSSGHTGFECVFDSTVTLEQDLFRRDLTINAIAYDEEFKMFIDPYGGMSDIASKTLRHVSSAFSEDPLRVIRLARLHSKLKTFTINNETSRMCREIVASGEMESISSERYWGELVKVFSSDPVPTDFIKALYLLDVMQKVKFFKDIFSSTANQHLSLSVVRSYLKSSLDTELYIAAFIAFFTNGSNLSNRAIPKRVSTLVNNIYKVFDIADDTTPEEMYTVIHRTRSFSERSPDFNDIIAVIDLWEMPQMLLRIFKYKLMNAQDAASYVKAKDFPELEGPKLGLAISDARLKAIEKDYTYES